jgi:hypothetical protein
MAIRVIDAPASRRRSTTQFFTDAELKAAVKALDGGSTPGDGPFDSLKAARTQAQRLKKELLTRMDVVVGTQAWEENDGSHYVVKIKSAE